MNNTYTFFQRHELRQAVFGAVVIAVIFAGGCDDKMPDVSSTMMGKTKVEILETLGQPTKRWDRDTVILDPRDHTQTEIDDWVASTPSYELEYDDVTILFNVHDVVIEVQKKR